MVTSKSRTVSLFALLLLGSIILLASLIGLGSFDPIADNEPIWNETLDLMQLPSKTRDIRWLKEDLPQSPISVRVTASHKTGDLDNAYGVLFGQGEDNMAIMISPLGYVAIWQQPASMDSEIEHHYLPWQTWPHVNSGELTNEIFVNLNGDTMSVRVNREWLWETEGLDRVDRIGIIGESYGEDASIDFQFAEISAVESRE